MSEHELMTETDIHAFGVQIMVQKLEADGWLISAADPFGDRERVPQLVANKDGETAFFVVRTAMHPGRGRIEGEEVFQNMVAHATAHGASCYFASIGIASSLGESDEEKSTPVKGIAYHISFDGLIQMAQSDKVLRRKLPILS